MHCVWLVWLGVVQGACAKPGATPFQVAGAKEIVPILHDAPPQLMVPMFLETTRSVVEQPERAIQALPTPSEGTCRELWTSVMSRADAPLADQMAWVAGCPKICPKGLAPSALARIGEHKPHQRLDALLAECSTEDDAVFGETAAFQRASMDVSQYAAVRSALVSLFELLEQSKAPDADAVLRQLRANAVPKLAVALSNQIAPASPNQPSVANSAPAVGMPVIDVTATEVRFEGTKIVDVSAAASNPPAPMSGLTEALAAYRKQVRDARREPASNNGGDGLLGPKGATNDLEVVLIRADASLGANVMRAVFIAVMQAGLQAAIGVQNPASGRQGVSPLTLAAGVGHSPQTHLVWVDGDTIRWVHAAASKTVSMNASKEEFKALCSAIGDERVQYRWTGAASFGEFVTLVDRMQQCTKPANPDAAVPFAMPMTAD